MSSWTLAPALVQLRKELDDRWPNRDRTSDGTIGDAAHAARKSEHNPNRDPSDKVTDGMVTAMDIDVDGIDKELVLSKLKNTSRVWYVILDGYIYSRTYNWAKNRYTGADPHTSHIHVSLRQDDVYCKDTRPWGIGQPTTHTPDPVPAKETPFQRVSRIAHQRLVRIKRLRRKLNG